MLFCDLVKNKLASWYDDDDFFGDCDYDDDDFVHDDDDDDADDVWWMMMNDDEWLWMMMNDDEWRWMMINDDALWWMIMMTGLWQGQEEPRFRVERQELPSLPALSDDEKSEELDSERSRSRIGPEGGNTESWHLVTAQTVS